MCTKNAHITAHEHCMHNRAEIEKSKYCGCFYCLSIFDANAVAGWKDAVQDTAECPYCRVDSVIGDASGFEITEALLEKMQEYWF